MIFLSAQPDDFYFTWQLEIQIMNFQEKGVLGEKDEMHILIAYNPVFGVSNYYNLLQKKYSHISNVNFFFYPDKRERKNYQSSLRPNIIHQHFSKHACLYKENIFYHDSDILFLEKIDFVPLLADDIWYGSDTGSYLNINYVSNFDKNLIYLMANIVDIDSEAIRKSDKNTIGAQYLLKSIPRGFWKKIESDSESIFDLLSNFNSESEFIKSEGQILLHENINKIQDWCSDMWAILYNSLYFRRTVKISNLLDFCWAGTRISGRQVSILHYTGVDSEDTNLFKKGNFTFYPPFESHYLESLSPLYYGYFVTTYLKQLRKNRTYNFDILIDSKDRDDQKLNILRKYYADYSINVNYVNINLKEDNSQSCIKLSDHIIFSPGQLEKINCFYREKGSFAIRLENPLVVNFIVKDIFCRCIQYDFLEKLHYLLIKADPLIATFNMDINNISAYDSLNTNVYII